MPIRPLSAWLPASWACAWRGRHEPRRTWTGAFRCEDCGAVGADLDELGFSGGGYVPLLRRLFSREPYAHTRTESYDAEPGLVSASPGGRTTRAYVREVER